MWVLVAISLISGVGFVFSVKLLRYSYKQYLMSEDKRTKQDNYKEFCIFLIEFLSVDAIIFIISVVLILTLILR